MPDPDKSYDVPEEAPEERAGDVVRKLVKAGASGVPVIGGPVAELMDLLRPSVDRRKDEWFEDIAHELNSVRRRVAALENRDIYEDEAFVTTVINASSIAVRSHQGEKREALKNAVLNSALHNEPDEDLQAIFLELVDRFTPWHLCILNFFNGPRDWFDQQGRQPKPHMLGGPAQVLEEAFPELVGKREFYDLIDADLSMARLMGGGSLHVTMTGDGMVSSRTTPLGQSFLKFITKPSELE
jgi:hypothetical protein